MLGITLRKLLAKRWMFFCMLLGCVLMIATIISLPLYENANFDKMLRDEFRDTYVSTGEWPAKYYVEFQSPKRTNARELHEREAFLEGVGATLGVTTKESVRLYETVERQLRTTMDRDDAKAHYKIHISMLADMGEHVEVLSGEMYSEDGYTDEGYLEVVLTTDCMVDNGFIVGEVLKFSTFRDSAGDLLKIQIVGIVEPRDNDLYWEIGTERLDTACFISEAAFKDMFLGANASDYVIDGYHCYLFDYEDLTDKQVENILTVIEDEAYSGNSFGPILEQYKAKRFRISATLLILQIPMIMLLVSFLFMISKQMFEVERNEIAVIKSRGSSGNQMFRLYFYQTGILLLLGLVLGIPLGIFFFRMLGSASGFLEFEVRRKLDIIFDEKVFLYLTMALVLIIAILSLPAIKHSKVSIVNLKQDRALKKKAFWERCFLDIICLLIGYYGHYFFSREGDRIAESVIRNEPLNPILYISSTLFIVGAGLLFLRLLAPAIQLIYKLGEGRWKPATYTSFLEVMRSGRKQHFIMLFLILTIAFGIYHSAVAETIMDNAVANAEYLYQADSIIKEKWRSNAANVAADGGNATQMFFYEADDKRYQTLDSVKAYTKVYYDDTSEATKRVEVQVTALDVNMMLIHSREFGEMTWVDQRFLDEHYYEYLNLLVDEETGFIVSSNFAERTGYQVGSAINVTYTVYMLESGSSSEINNSKTRIRLSGKIVGIVDYWPGYVPIETYLDINGEVKEKQNYLVVGSYFPFEESMRQRVQPYEIWVDFEEGTDSAEVANWINDQNMRLEKYIDGQKERENVVTDPLLQGTNGILTMEFMVMLLLCAVGYLVYWMMSIRDRELLFGVFRAFGMHRGEIFAMLMLEQLFSGVLTTFVAMGIGRLSVRLFAPIMLEAYTAQQQVLPMELAFSTVDMFRLYGSIGLVLLLSLVVLIRFVFKLNVAEALKLGED